MSYKYAVKMCSEAEFIEWQHNNLIFDEEIMSFINRTEANEKTQKYMCKYKKVTERLSEDALMYYCERAGLITFDSFDKAFKKGFVFIVKYLTITGEIVVAFGCKHSIGETIIAAESIMEE